MYRALLGPNGYYVAWVDGDGFHYQPSNYNGAIGDGARERAEAEAERLNNEPEEEETDDYPEEPPAEPRNITRYRGCLCAEEGGHWGGWYATAWKDSSVLLYGTKAWGETIEQACDAALKKADSN